MDYAHPTSRPYDNTPPGARTSETPGADRHSPARGKLRAFAWLGHSRTVEERLAGTGSEDRFDELARMAVQEPWEMPMTAEPGSLGILKYYVTWTFEQALLTEAVLPSPDADMCVFNTGLITRQHEDIYGIFRPNHRPDQQDWILAGWLVAGAPQLDVFPELPSAAVYSQDPLSYVYDWDLPLDFSARQLIPLISGLLPAGLKEFSLGLELMLAGAVNRARDIAKRYPGTAVPAWQPGGTEIQLLLPLYLADPATPDAALVLSRGDTTYRCTAIVSPAQGYKEARLITRPTAHWLDSLT